MISNGLIIEETIIFSKVFYNYYPLNFLYIIFYEKSFNEKNSRYKKYIMITKQKLKIL